MFCILNDLCGWFFFFARTMMCTWLCLWGPHIKRLRSKLVRDSLPYWIFLCWSRRRFLSTQSHYGLAATLCWCTEGRQCSPCPIMKADTLWITSLTPFFLRRSVQWLLREMSIRCNSSTFTREINVSHFSGVFQKKKKSRTPRIHPHITGTVIIWNVISGSCAQGCH